MQTLDLYHNRVDDPRLVAIAFQQLQDNHPEAELHIISIEKRGKNKDKVLIRAETSTQANHSELHAEYFTTYDELQALSPVALQRLLAEKDGQIRMLAGMVETAIKRPGMYANTYHQVGDIMSDRQTGSGDVSISGGNFAAVGSITGHNPGTVSGTQNIYQSEQRQTLAEAAAEIQQLLKQLEQTNPTATEVEQKAFLTAVIPPTKREKFVNALQSGGKELFKELMDNIYVNVAVAAIEGWQSAE